MVATIFSFKRLALLCATLVFLAVTGGGGNIARAQDECPPGYTMRSGNLIIGGCIVTAYFCVNCAGVTHPTYDFRLHHFTLPKNCQTTLSCGEIINGILREAQNPRFMFTVLCQSAAEPCPAHYYTVNFKNYFCWKVIHTTSYGEEIFKSNPCNGDAYCLDTYQVCYDPVTLQYQYFNRHQTPVGDPTCGGAPYAADTSLPPRLGDTTDCMQISWPCIQY